MSVVIKVKVPKGEGHIEVPQALTGKAGYVGAIRDVAVEFAKQIADVVQPVDSTPSTSRTLSQSDVSETSADAANTGRNLQAQPRTDAITRVPSHHLILKVEFVNRVRGENFMITVQRDTMISCLQEFIQRHSAAPLRSLTLSHRGRLPWIHETLDDCGAENGDTLIVTEVLLPNDTYRN